MKKATDMTAHIFERALEPSFVDALRHEAARNGWWRDVLDDPQLVVATRGTMLNVYWQGQALFTVTYPRKDALLVTTHEKYLLDPALNKSVALGADGCFDTTALLKHALLERYEGPATLAKLKTASALFAGGEKEGCHEIAVRNPNVIDVEIAFSRENVPDDDLLRKIPRIDLAAVEPDGPDARLVFWEAKTYDNKELRTSKEEPARVCHQVAEYRTVVRQHRALLEASYARVAANLIAFEEMGWKRKLSPLLKAIGAGEIRLQLGDEPKIGLIVFGYDAGQRDAVHWQPHRDKLQAFIKAVKFGGEAKGIKL